MNKLWLLLLLAIPHQTIHAQEVHHAPTVEQCRADQRLWLSKKLDEDPQRSGVAHVSNDELNAWVKEMDDCERVDPETAKGYYNTLGEATTEQLIQG